MKLISLEAFSRNAGIKGDTPSGGAKDSLRESYDELLEKGRKARDSIDTHLYELRKLALVYGLPDETPSESANVTEKCTLRAKVWKILLRVKSLDAQQYIEYVQKGPFGGASSETYQQIRRDTGRTHVRDVEFQRRVPEEKLSRVLNVLMHSCSDQGIVYVQGMNYIAAIFLYVLPELDAFHCLREVVLHHCPLYYSGHKKDEVRGAKLGAVLVEKCLEVVDPQLHDHLKKTDSPSELYAEFMYGLNSNYPPLDEVVKLWDLMFAFGVHLNVIITVARIVMQRTDLLAAAKPNVPGILDDIDAELIISVTIQLVRQIPMELFERLVEHTRGKEKEDEDGNENGDEGGEDGVESDSEDNVDDRGEKEANGTNGKRRV